MSQYQKSVCSQLLRDAYHQLDDVDEALAKDGITTFQSEMSNSIQKIRQAYQIIQSIAPDEES